MRALELDAKRAGTNKTTASAAILLLDGESPAAKNQCDGTDIGLAELFSLYPPAIRKADAANRALKPKLTAERGAARLVMALPRVKIKVDAMDAQHKPVGEKPKTATACSVSPKRRLAERDHADFLAPIFRVWLDDEGLPLHVIADGLNAAGIVAPRGGKWTVYKVQQLVKRLGL